MSLKLKDLVEHEERLNRLVKHMQQELDAVQLLIKGIMLREENTGSTRASAKKTTIVSALDDYIEKQNSSPFTVETTADGIIKAGIRKESDRANLRTIVANYLKRKTEKGELNRKNVGTGKRKKYEYRSN